MTAVTFDTLGNDIKEPTFIVWVNSYSKPKLEVYWQGESFYLAIYKMVAAKTRGWWCVKLEWKE